MTLITVSAILLMLGAVACTGKVDEREKQRPEFVNVKNEKLPGATIEEKKGVSAHSEDKAGGGFQHVNISVRYAGPSLRLNNAFRNIGPGQKYRLMFNLPDGIYASISLRCTDFLVQEGHIKLKTPSHIVKFYPGGRIGTAGNQNQNQNEEYMKLDGGWRFGILKNNDFEMMRLGFNGIIPENPSFRESLGKYTSNRFRLDYAHFDEFPITDGIAIVELETSEDFSGKLSGWVYSWVKE